MAQENKARMGRRYIIDSSESSGLVKSILKELETGNPQLNVALKDLMIRDVKIPQYLQVLKESEVESFNFEDYESRKIFNQVKQRIKNSGYLNHRISGGIPMGSSLSSRCPSANYYSMIRDYCIEKGNAYDLEE